MRCVVWTPRCDTDANPRRGKWILAREVQKSWHKEWYGEQFDDTNSRRKCGTRAFAAERLLIGQHLDGEFRHSLVDLRLEGELRHSDQLHCARHGFTWFAPTVYTEHAMLLNMRHRGSTYHARTAWLSLHFCRGDNTVNCLRRHRTSTNTCAVHTTQ